MGHWKVRQVNGNVDTKGSVKRYRRFANYSTKLDIKNNYNK